MGACGPVSDVDDGKEAPQRDYLLREVFNGLRFVVRGGILWRMLPNDLLP